MVMQSGGGARRQPAALAWMMVAFALAVIGGTAMLIFITSGG